MTPLPRIGAPAPADPAAAGIVHLGLGAFHRAHAAVHTALALAAEPGDWGILGVAHRSRRVVDPLARQGGAYALLELSPDGRTAGIVDVHRGTAVMAEEPARVAREIAAAPRRIVTLTVTEAGYASTSMPVGLIARGLAARAHHGEPITVLPCDNVTGAGDTLRRAVTERLHRDGASEDALAFVRERVAFPNAMVDRIVPATTPATSDEVEQLLGVRDDVPVRTERFSMWVMQDDFPAGRPAWERAGARFSTEVEGYEEVKLRVLNGTHSLIAYLGALDHRESIPAAFDQDHVATAALALIHREMLPTIALPHDMDIQDYVRELERRWHNHPLGHRTVQVGSDGSMRLPQRLPAPALHHLRQGRMPHLIALTVAAWFACVLPPAGFEPGPQAVAMSDPEAARLRAVAEGARGPREHARLLLTDGCLGDELAGHDPFVDRVSELLETIVRGGSRAAAAEALAAA